MIDAIAKERDRAIARAVTAEKERDEAREAHGNEKALSERLFARAEKAEIERAKTDREASRFERDFRALVDDVARAAGLATPEDRVSHNAIDVVPAVEALRAEVERLKAEVASEARHCAAAIVERDEANAYAMRLFRVAEDHWKATPGSALGNRVAEALDAAPESVKRAAEI